MITALKSAKAKWLKILVLFMFAISVLLLIAGVLYVNGSKMPVSAFCDEIGEYSLKAENEIQEFEFLRQFGLTAETDSLVCDTVVIPKNFNQVYNSYNRLQQKIGLDLNNYKGVSAKRRVYTLKDFSDDGRKYTVTLLVYRERVIGGHISSGVYGEEYLALCDTP